MVQAFGCLIDSGRETQAIQRIEYHLHDIDSKLVEKVYTKSNKAISLEVAAGLVRRVGGVKEAAHYVRVCLEHVLKQINLKDSDENSEGKIVSRSTFRVPSLNRQCS